MSRRLIVIDPYISARSPSMRAWLGQVEALRGLFHTIEVWAIECEVEGEGIVWRKFPKVGPVWRLQSMIYTMQVRRAMRKAKLDGETIVQCTGCYVPVADIRYMHFWNRAFLEAARERPEALRMAAVEKWMAEKVAAEELAACKPGKTGAWWAVSRRLGEAIDRDCGGKAVVRLLPNQYDESRFNAAARERWREEMRRHYGFEDGQTVLIFAGFGHFERKGLRQAVEAVRGLRSAGHAVELLVLGGNAKSIGHICKQLGAGGPEGLEGVHFAGVVSDMERHLAAGDALFFPSHFEAFSLIEIEAAAVGLPLYLTPHFGSEMIVREGINGRILPWDVAGMVEILGEEISKGAMGRPHGEMGDALDRKEYGERLKSLYEEAIQSKGHALT